MSKAIITEQHLHDIADAIIAKGGATAPMTPAQMPGAIAEIPSGEEPLYAPAMFDDVKMTPPEWFEDGKVHIWVDFDLDPREDTIGIYIGANSVGCVEVDWGDGAIETNTTAYTYGVEMAHTYDKERDGNQFVITIALKNGETTTRYGYTGSFVNKGGVCVWAIEITYPGYGHGGSGDGLNDTSICLHQGLRYLKVSGTYFKGAFCNTFVMSTLRDIITSVYTGARNSLFVSGLPITRIPDWVVMRGTLGFNSFSNCRQLRKIDDSLFDGVSFTNCQGIFQNCNSLVRVPDTLDLSSCTNCSNMFASCASLVRVPDTLDLSACTNCSNMFVSCASLVRVPDTLDLSSCTNCQGIFQNCNSLVRVPDTLDLSSCTNCSNMFASCNSLAALPTHVTAIRGLSFAQSSAVSKDSVATFDENGNVVGGFVGNLNTKPSDAGTQTMAFHANTKSLFTADEWTAVKTCLTDKGWAVTPA